MNRAVLSLSLSALMLGGAMVGCAQGAGGLASASGRAVNPAAQAAASARSASQALAHDKAGDAVAYAEAAATMVPGDASYRMLLAQSYLKAGRFASARQAFADVLQLSPGNGTAALDLVLSQIAEGQWANARHTLDAHAAMIAPGDRGLALALAGDPAGGVKLLLAAARAPGADARTRQNLALALALAGDWTQARMVVATDLSPTDADRRMAEWASFAKPAHAYDQVAALLGVTAVEDPGQPATLALVAPAPADAVADVTEPENAAAPVAVAAIDQHPRVVFGPRREVVQPLPAPLLAAPASPIKVRAEAPSGGDWYVQIGAFSNAAVAQNGWARAQRRFAALRGHQPSGMHYSTRHGDLYRLSVGGFARADADALCRQYRAHGGACFVRTNGGDAVAQWVHRDGVEMASR